MLCKGCPIPLSSPPPNRVETGSSSLCAKERLSWIRATAKHCIVLQSVERPCKVQDIHRVKKNISAIYCSVTVFIFLLTRMNKPDCAVLYKGQENDTKEMDTLIPHFQFDNFSSCVFLYREKHLLSHSNCNSKQLCEGFQCPFAAVYLNKVLSILHSLCVY